MQFQAYLSLPEGTTSAAGLVAMMTDHYNILVRIKTQLLFLQFCYNAYVAFVNLYLISNKQIVIIFHLEEE